MVEQSAKSKNRIRTSQSYSKPLHKALKEFCRKRGVSVTDFVESLVSKSIGRN